VHSAECTVHSLADEENCIGFFAECSVKLILGIGRTGRFAPPLKPVVRGRVA